MYDLSFCFEVYYIFILILIQKSISIQFNSIHNNLNREIVQFLIVCTLIVYFIYLHLYVFPEAQSQSPKPKT